MSDKELTGPEPTENWLERKHVRPEDLAQQIDEIHDEVSNIMQEVALINKRVRQIFEQLATGARTVTETVSVNPDSIAVGAPANGQIKVYSDFNKAKDFEKKIDTAKELLDKATKSGE
jgi:ribosomal protein S24E